MAMAMIHDNLFDKFEADDRQKKLAAHELCTLYYEQEKALHQYEIACERINVEL